MTMTTQSQPITNISDMAMLVGLSLRMFNPIKTDKKITQEVADAHGSDVTMGRYAKSVVAKECLEAIRQHHRAIRSEHYRRTLPWSEDGARILTSAGYTDYAAWMRSARAKLEPLEAEFFANWERYVQEAQVKLNGLFDPADYPSLEVLRGKFEFRTKVRQVPTANDFRVSLGANEVSAIKAEMQADLQQTITDAMKDVWTRMRDVVSKMAERLKLYDPNNPTSAPFRDTLVSNIAELLEVLPSLNLTKDPAVSEFTASMRQLVAYDAQTLRDDMFARNDTATRADQILAQMSAFVA